MPTALSHHHLLLVLHLQDELHAEDLLVLLGLFVTMNGVIGVLIENRLHAKDLLVLQGIIFGVIC